MLGGGGNEGTREENAWVGVGVVCVCVCVCVCVHMPVRVGDDLISEVGTSYTKVAGDFPTADDVSWAVFVHFVANVVLAGGRVRAVSCGAQEKVENSVPSCRAASSRAGEIRHQHEMCLTPALCGAAGQRKRSPMSVPHTKCPLP